MPREVKVKDIQLTGKLVTGINKIAIGNNFSELKNLRYTDVGLESISGVSKINTTALVTYLKPRNCFQFKSNDNSYFLSQVWNTGLTDSRLLVNSTVVPNQGNFSSTVLFDETSASYGRFCYSPLGELIYCNSKDVKIWGGDDYIVNKVYLVSSQNLRDASDFLCNNSTETTSDLSQVSYQTNITTSVLTLNFDTDTVAEVEGIGYTISVTGTPVLSDAKQDCINASKSMKCFSSAGYISINDHTNFNLSGGTFYFYARLFMANSGASGVNYLYRQYDDANNYMTINVQYNSTQGGFRIVLEIKNSPDTLTITTDYILYDGYWYVLEIREDDNTYRIYIDGILVNLTSSAIRAKNYTGVVKLLTADTGVAGKFYCGELLLSRTTKTIDLLPGNLSYADTYDSSTAKNVYELLIGSKNPLEGFNIGVSVAAATTFDSVPVISYWKNDTDLNINGWVRAELTTDGTAVGGKTLQQSGLISFTEQTGTSASMRVINDTLLYWYRLTFELPATLYKVTGKGKFSSLLKTWDGEYLTCLAFFKLVSGVYTDYTLNIFEYDYVSSVTSTFAEIGGLTSSDSVLIGFVKPICGFYVDLPDVTKVNTTDNVYLTISSWNGSAWVVIRKIYINELYTSDKLFSYSGLVVFDPLNSDSNTVSLTSINNSLSLYFYRLTINTTLSANVRINFIGGIPTESYIDAYKFAVSMQNRLWLCNNQYRNKNTAVCSSFDTSTIFSGDDTTELVFGNSGELVAATSLYGLFGSGFYDLMVFFKQNETWVITGTSTSNWVKYLASESIGCVAPLSLITAHVGFEVVPSANRYIAIFQSSSGVHLFDGKIFYQLDGNISDKFDVRKTGSINPLMSDKSFGFYDTVKQEYHLLIATGSATSLNEEWVFDLKRQKWFQIDRGSVNYLQCACSVSDTYGNEYIYGGVDAGYFKRLEHTNQFDGVNITGSFVIGSLNLSSTLFVSSVIRDVKLVLNNTTATTNVQCIHYGDGDSTGSSFTLSPVKTGYSIAQPSKSNNFGDFTMHSLSFSLTTNELVGFSPYLVSVVFKEKGLEG